MIGTSVLTLMAVSAVLVLIGQRVTLWALPQLDRSRLPVRVLRRLRWWERSARVVSVASLTMMVAAIAGIVIARP